MVSGLKGEDVVLLYGPSHLLMIVGECPAIHEYLQKLQKASISTILIKGWVDSAFD